MIVEFFEKLFSADFLPHGHCFFWTPSLLWLDVVSNSLIALSYYSIPITLMYFVRRRRDLPYPWIFALFGTFILACGTTHVLEIWTLWIPTYRLDILVKIVTAAISVSTAVLLVPLVPKALALQSPAELEVINRQLAAEIADRKRTELELSRARDAALRSDRLKSAFIANMSHEIRTPLNVILGYNSVIAEDLAKLDESSRQALVDGVRRGGNRLMSTIHGILDISKIESGNFDVHPVRLDLRPLIEQQVEDFRMLARDKGLTLSCTIGTEHAIVVCDEYCLSNALTNLLQNAIKFTERGGVWVTLDRDFEGRLRLSVGDTGVGIDEAYLRRLFEPFSQEEAGYTRRFEGSGLGLALTRDYLALNGASISVDSRKGHGSLFRIHFPETSDFEVAMPCPPGEAAAEAVGNRSES